jgi:hypothetical protein
MCTTRLKEKIMHTTCCIRKKLCVQLIVEEKMYAQVNLQTIVHTNCTEQFCVSPNLCL